MSEYWFKRKRYGWGWTPMTWQRWAVIGIYLVAIILAGVNARITQGDITIIRTSFVPETIFYTAILIVICLLTGKPPKWQWGKKK